jgi:hypothetical protein
MLKALIKGFWRVVSSPGLIVWIWLVSFAAALPLTWVMSESIQSSLGGSLVSDKLRDGFDMGWFGEFESGAKGLETTFTPTVAGAGAFYNNLEAWLSGSLFEMYPGLVGLGILWALLCALFLGGVLERYSGSEGMFNLSRFFATGGRFFFRFVRLAVISGSLYYLVYRFGGWILGWVEESTLDVTIETTVLARLILAAVVISFLLTLVNMVFDYAKIATFKEDRRSMVLAAFRGIGLVFSNPLKTMGLYYSLVAVGVLLMLFYSTIAPGVQQSTTTSVLLAFLVGQGFLVAKLMLRLWFYGGQMALYEILTTMPVEPKPAAAE